MCANVDVYLTGSVERISSIKNDDSSTRGGEVRIGTSDIRLTT